jgi:hypothetical protein
MFSGANFDRKTVGEEKTRTKQILQERFFEHQFRVFQQPSLLPRMETFQTEKPITIFALSKEKKKVGSGTGKRA